MTVPSFECRPIVKGSCVASVPSYFTTDEDDAVAWAKANATRDLEQVTIEVVAAGDVSTFAIRHLKFDGTDTGWSCWLHGDKVATRSLEMLFGHRVVT